MLNFDKKQFFFAFVLADFLFLCAYAVFLDISATEYEYVFESNSVAGYVLSKIFALFGQSNFLLRIPFITIHVANLVLIYAYARRHSRQPQDALLAVFIYALLPGVNSAALLANNAGFVIFSVLIFLNIYDKNKTAALGFLLLGAFLDKSFLLLAFSMVFYGLYKKDRAVLSAAVIAFAVSYHLHGFDTGSRPKGYFLEVFGIYAAIFSPLVFFYFIYTLYWFLFRTKTNLPPAWFVSFSVFALSIILSMRQSPRLEDFAVFTVVAVPLMSATFLHSLRVRLPEFRKKIKGIFYIVLASLILNTGLTFFNKPLYLLLAQPQKHFAFSHHFTRELASELRSLGSPSVIAPQDLQKQLAFYGIKRGGKRLELKEFKGSKPISISVFADKKIHFFLEN